MGGLVPLLRRSRERHPSGERSWSFGIVWLRTCVTVEVTR